MRVSTNTNSATKLLISAIVLYAIVEVAFANEQLDEASTDDEPGLRVVIPIGEENASIIDKDIRNKMLSEKLIKMGRAKSQSCTRCHGRSGMASLANAINWEKSITEFVVKHLTELREGKRAHAVMSSIAAPLSDQDIALIAAWYQSVSPNDVGDH